MTDKTDSKEREADALIRKLRDVLDECRSYIDTPTLSPLMESEAAIAVEEADIYLAGRASLAANAGSEPVVKVECDCAAQDMPFGTCCKVRKEFEQWYDAQPDGRMQPFDVWRAAWGRRYTHPSPPEGMVGGWQDIATAPEGQMVVVGWLDPEDAEHPERHDFDLLEDGCWQQWHERAEHVEVIGGHGVSYTPPYTVWMPVSPIPTSSANSRKGE
ncbi:hypothetical protein ACTJKQ_14155 [Acidovorax sp. 22279]|uniref:hypothetical protein n=1 Tax=Acidovorax sp. 22279 TaxID=3453900 RepID=UPI003F836F42